MSFPEEIPSSSVELENKLKELSESLEVPLASLQFAEKMDAIENIKSRSFFSIPTVSQHDSTQATYMCGNSLGLCSKAVLSSVNEEMNKWSTMGVEGHFHGSRPWARIDEKSTSLFVPLVGALNENEIAVCNTLSANLHLLLLSFYNPQKPNQNENQNQNNSSTSPSTSSSPARYKILIEESAFCSDWHVITSQVLLHGLDPNEAIITLKPNTLSNHTPNASNPDPRSSKNNYDINGVETITTESIVETIQKHGDELALVLLGGVQFYTGQLFDMKTITMAAHKVGALCGFDLAHAVGNVPLSLHDWNVDFAAWCSYKYLNAGPGATAALFFHQNHFNKINAKLKGWWGQECGDRFAMNKYHTSKLGAGAFMLSNPPVLPLVCLESSLKIFQQVGGISKLRIKSVYLTGFLEHLLRMELLDPYPHRVSQLTPIEPNARGCQISLKFSFAVRPLVDELTKIGVIVDAREPNVIRISPAPLYNSFYDVFNAVKLLKQTMINLKLIQ